MFLVLEGSEGSGKTTQINLTVEWLQSLGYKVAKTKEPGGEDSIGSVIRELLINPDIEIDPITELFLYSTDRANHIQKVINPSLVKNDCLICDRFLLSTIVYQGYGRKINKDLIHKCIEISISNLNENITPIYIWIDGDIKQFLSRKKNKDRIEQEELNFHQSVYEGYKELHQEYPSVIFRVNGNQSPLDLQGDIRKVIVNLSKAGYLNDPFYLQDFVNNV